MSGDVQPRKRKDKRRKKDEAPGVEEPTIQPSAAPTVNEDFNIHVHNDHGTGGGICAKLVFFALLAILAVLIGMIFVEKRGLTDLDTAPTESRFAQIFDGWIDESLNDHDHEDDHAPAIDDHDEHESDEHGTDDEDHHASEEEEEEGHDDHEADDEEHQSEELQISEEADEQTEEADEDQVSEEPQEDEEEEDEQQVSNEQDEETKEDEEDDENESAVDDNINEVSTEEPQEDDDENEEANETNEDDQEADDDDYDNTQRIDDEDDGEATNGDDNEDTNEEIENEEDDNASNQIEDDVAEDDVSKENEIIEEDSAEENIADDLEDDEEVVDNTAGEDEIIKEESEKEEAVEEESSSMAVKFGVGVALVVVAHIVLVRKWRSGQPTADKSALEEEIIPDLSRRNTVVAPAPLEQIENEIEDEYSEEDEELESEEEIIIEPIKTKQTYQQLQTTYARSLPPETITTKTNLETRVFYYDDDNQENEEEIEDEEEEEEVEEDNEVVEEDDEVVEEDDDAEEIESGDENEEISDVDDEELLKKLEMKYGKLPSQRDNKAETKNDDDDRFSSWKKIKVLPDSAEESEGSDDGHWTQKESIPADLQQKMKLAESSLQDNAELSLNLFTNLLEKLPNNIFIKHGRAKALDQLAEKKRSNELLQDAISSYIDLLQSKNISDKLYLEVAERCIDRIRFRGHYNRAIQVHKDIISRFPNSPKYRNQLAVTFLTSNRLAEANNVLKEVLSRWPNDGFAQVHYGFLLKTRDNNLVSAIKYLKSGIESREPGVIDGRFYFHLGDALTRIGKNEDAMKVYEDGVKHNVFLSKYQRSLYNVNRLTAKPWWPLNKTPYAWFFQLLEENWRAIRNEGLALLNKAGYFKDESENLRDTGEWKQFELFARGQKFTENCKKCPDTCKLIENLPDAKNCRRGQVKFSIMHPGTHVWPHCGPSNCRLRAHLGLKVPSNTFIRVADETRSWKEGKVFLFDDSFEHEVWHNGSDIRLVLIIDVWHPELTPHEKRSLPAI